MSEPDLKPCPFCGGSASAEEYGGDAGHGVCWEIGCDRFDDCLADAPAIRGFALKSEAVKAWNTRMSDWQSISLAPKDGTKVLLFTTCHGQVEAWRDQGVWTDHFETGREYSGSSWVCADDAFQIEIEEGPDNYENHGTATHWQPLPPPPVQGED